MKTFISMCKKVSSDLILDTNYKLTDDCKIESKLKRELVSLELEIYLTYKKITKILLEFKT